MKKPYRIAAAILLTITFPIWIMPAALFGIVYGIYFIINSILEEFSEKINKN
jgi:hypothetical protein